MLNVRTMLPSAGALTACNQHLLHFFKSQLRCAQGAAGALCAIWWSKHCIVAPLHFTLLFFLLSEQRMYQWHFLPWVQIRFDDTLVGQDRVLEAIEDAGFEAKLLSSSSATPGAKVCLHLLLHSRAWDAGVHCNWLARANLSLIGITEAPAALCQVHGWHICVNAHCL